MIILAIVSIPVLLLILLSPDLILDFLGKDATLTGRTDLWRFVDIDIAQRPNTRMGDLTRSGRAGQSGSE